MKVLFLSDNTPTTEMYHPIISQLKCDYLITKTDYNIVQKEKPDVIVMAREETTPDEHKIVDSGIPTLLIPHGMLMPEVTKKLWGNGRKSTHYKRLMFQAIYKIKHGESPLRLLKTGLFRLKNDYKNGVLSKYSGFTKIAVYGEAMKDTLIKYDVKPENIVVTGNPKFDKYYGKIRRNNGYVLLLTEYFVEFGYWTPKQRESYLKHIWLATSINKLNLVVKIHPVLERKDDYEKLAKIFNFKVYQHESLSDLILNCNMAVTLLSSAGLEVMIAGKPLIIYNPYKDPTIYESVALYAKDRTSLFNAMGCAKYYETLGAEEFVKNHAYIQDGKSSERIANLIMEMANC